MLVCHCKAVSEREVRSHASSGARTVNEVGKRCGAGRVCGGCRPVIAEILSERAAGASQGSAAHGVVLAASK